MTKSYSVIFSMQLTDAKPTHPKGLAVAEWLQAAMLSRGIRSDLENWRDSGYSLDCIVDGTPVYLVISRVTPRLRTRELGRGYENRSKARHAS